MFIKISFISTENILINYSNPFDNFNEQNVVCRFRIYSEVRGLYLLEVFCIIHL